MMNALKPTVVECTIFCIEQTGLIAHQFLVYCGRKSMLETDPVVQEASLFKVLVCSYIKPFSTTLTWQASLLKTELSKE